MNTWGPSVGTLSVYRNHHSEIPNFPGVFGLLQIVAFAQLVRTHVSSNQFRKLLQFSVVIIGLLGALAFAFLTYKGKIAPWTGRFYSLWDTGYAKKWVSTLGIQSTLY